MTSELGWISLLINGTGAKTMKFVIVSPRQKYGGSIALHQLCSLLSKKGYDARIFYTQTYVYRKHKHFAFWCKWIAFTLKDLVKLILAKLLRKSAIRLAILNGYSYCPVKGCRRKLLPVIGKETVVIYPDTVYGNFLHATHVVRWLLYFNRYPDDPHAYGKQDLFICYRDIFNDKKLNPKGNRVTISYFDLDLYKKTTPSEQREGKCYIIRKGASRNDLPTFFDGPVIDNMSEPDKVQTFNRCRYCISYDTQTAYMKIAALCGCLPVVIPESGKGREDYTAGESESYGVAYGFSEEEIAFATQTQGKVTEWFKSVNVNNENNVNEFLRLVKQWYQ